MIAGQESVSGPPTGSPVGLATMFDLAARPDSAPQTEHLPMTRIKEASGRLAACRPRYRIVLDSDSDLEKYVAVSFPPA